MINTLGLANRARKVTVGTPITIESIQKSECCLVFLANDAAFNTMKKVRDKAKFYNVTVIEDFSSKEISLAIGKSKIKVIGIKDSGFCKLLKGKKEK